MHRDSMKVTSMRAVVYCLFGVLDNNQATSCVLMTSKSGNGPTNVERRRSL